MIPVTLRTNSGRIAPSIPSPDCSSCPNHPHYYWNQALECFDQFTIHENSIYETESYMYLILHEISVQGD